MSKMLRLQARHGFKGFPSPQKIRFFFFAVVLSFFAALTRVDAASVTFEGESGTLGSDFAVSNSSSPVYITILTDGSGSTPSSAARVASYTVTFPAAGTYQLYARVRVGPGAFNDDSLFYAASFGVKSPTTSSDWVQVNGLAGVGFTNSTDVVTGGGTLGTQIWKWINLSQFTSKTGFTVSAGNLTQTFQIGARENGLDLDKFLFGSSTNTFTVAELDAGGPGTPPPPLPAPTLPLAVTNTSGASLVVGSNGIYTVSFISPAWTFTGYLAQSLTNRTLVSGSDNIGGYSEISFNYTNTVGHATGIRLYNNLPVVIFSDTTLAAGSNDLAFPHWNNYPALQNHLSFGGTFSPYHFDTLYSDNLWLFFATNYDAFIMSAATNYMVASTVMNGDNSISCGINSGISQLPASFTHRTILVAQHGINQTYTTWGAVLLALAGKTPPANDAAVELNKLGYWTDNGTKYYYNNPSGGIAATLLSMRDEFAGKGVPLGYLQLDSWWYKKGVCQCWQGDSNPTGGDNGIYLYVPDPALFTNGLASFQAQLGLPLFTHSRWIDSTSPYQTNYVMSGNVSVDTTFWTNIMSSLKNSGVITYEQDWLGVTGIPLMNLTDPPAYLNKMASAAAANGINLQYCMVQGRDYLQGSLYTNLMTTRTCPDIFDTNNWTAFLYGSRIAQAMGIWPWSDAFKSAATRNLLVSTLSAGPVGIGDALGAVNATNLLKSVRSDGVIVKPDVPLVPVDDAYVNDALGLNRPFMATTYTDHTNSRALYVFAYGENSTNLAASFVPAAFGVSGDAYVYDFFAGTGTVVNNGGAFNFNTVMPNGTNGGSYFIAVPIGPSGIAFLGDTNKFVTRGKKRISSLSDTGVLHVTVTFAPGETNVTLCGYAPSIPFVNALAGSTSNLTYNAATDFFSVRVVPNISGTATIQFQLASSTDSTQFEAESGTLGADFAVSNSSAPAYITIISTNSGSSPGNAARVATYTVTFPSAGTYQLYARIRVGSGGFSDDSLYYGNGFGVKDPTLGSDWITVNSLANVGFTTASNVVTGGGNAGTLVWKWINLSQFSGKAGFVVSAGNLTQTFQIGGREDGLNLDMFLFGKASDTFTVGQLDAGGPGTPPPNICTVDWNEVHQRIDGFGAGVVFMDAGLDPISSANADTLFSSANTNQLGLTLMRVRIAPNSSWTTSFSSWTNSLSDAKKAVARGARVMATPWTPPTSLKDTNSLVGGSVPPSQYANWAAYLNTYANYMRTSGVQLAAVSIQNEPDITVTYESCFWTSNQLQSFFRTNAVAITNAPVLMPESYHFDQTLSDLALNDPVAATNVAIVGGHLYGASVKDYPTAHNLGKPTWMTEYLVNDQTWPSAMDTAQQIHDCLTLGNMSAYIWWQSLDDSNGLVNASGVPQKRGFVMSQFSRFVRPGYFRVGATNAGFAQVSAYKGPNGAFTIVAVNGDSADITQNFTFTNCVATNFITPCLTTSNVWLAVQASVPVTNSSFAYTLPALSVVTFTGQISNGPPVINSIALVGGRASMLVSGPTNYVYTLQTSTNLVSWQTLQTTNPSVQPFIIMDTNSATDRARFYRVQTGP